MLGRIDLGQFGALVPFKVPVVHLSPAANLIVVIVFKKLLKVQHEAVMQKRRKILFSYFLTFHCFTYKFGGTRKTGSSGTSKGPTRYKL
jgi:hypothetical protein